MAAPALVAGTEQDGNGGPTATVTWAAGGANDIICIAWSAFQYISTNTPSLSGFTAFGTHQGTNSGQFQASAGWLLKAAGTTSSGSGTLTVSNCNVGMCDWISFRVSGGDTTVLAEAAAGADGNGLSPTAPTLTSGGADRLELIANFLNQDVTAAYSGFTNIAKWSASNAEGVWGKTITASGATGTFSATTVGSNTGWGLSAILIPPATGGSGVTGTAAVTLAAATAAAAGTEKISGTAPITLGAATVSASGGGTGVTGTAAITLAAATSSASGTEKIAGTAAITLGAATVVASGGKDSGTAAITLAAATVAASGDVTATGLLTDEFPGSSIDLSKWRVYNRLGDQVNNEVDGVITGNVRVSSGSLFIDSKFEDVVIGDTTTGAPNPRTVHYTSGQIAQKAGPFLYGDIQVRAKLPGGTGLWPCIWMLGYQWQASQPYTANVSGADWPNGGWWEIDIAEFMYDHRTQVNNALHFITASRTGSGEKTLPFDATSRFMVYRLIWTSTSLTWMVDAEDGVGWRTLTTMTGTPGTDIPDTAGYLIIHTAVGGNVANTPDSSTFPQSFEVDWAHVSQGGVGAVTLGAATASASGTEKIAGTAPVTLGAATVSAAGTQKISGSAAVTLGAATCAASGGMKIAGTAAVTLADATAAASGTEKISGSAAITLAPATVSGAGGGLPVTGTAAITLADVTAAATGTEKISGTTAVTLADAVAAAAGTEKITGTAAATLADATVSAAGTEKISGTAAVSLADATVNAAGTERIAGTAAITLAPATVYAAGGNLPVTGTAAVVLADATASASGTERIAGSGAAQLGAATVVASGVERYVGAVAVILAAALVVAAGNSHVVGPNLDHAGAVSVMTTTAGSVLSGTMLAGNVGTVSQ